MRPSSTLRLQVMLKAIAVFESLAKRLRDRFYAQAKNFARAILPKLKVRSRPQCPALSPVAAAVLTVRLCDGAGQEAGGMCVRQRLLGHHHRVLRTAQRAS